ncbi:OLC1v1031459C1 [Oldenlandia corymbosa var. corymbosa]|uniref:OLC1v1031459C1 n=1 Tax=Oldenlandia corymbosa var. corymbosa TaxID=529605 RepID=A0AAV1CJC4_OLDCO|nr:OLC1v1031459C1 [Oldenlandia corymbosa var. corymbosa]
MAEALPLVEFTSNKLYTFLSEEGSLLGGLRLEIQLISDEFGHMKSFLQKVSDSGGEVHDPQLAEWIRQRLVVTSSGEKEEEIILDLIHPISASSLGNLCFFELFGSLEKIPPWTINLQGLERISLYFSKLTADPLETLQHLPNLFEVRLVEAYQGDSLCFKAGCFLKLKELLLRGMNGLKRIKVEKGAMPGINELIMEDLPMLEELPVGIENLKQLQKLELLAVNSELTNKLENAAAAAKESDYSRKISHIPQVTIGFQVDGQWRSHRLIHKTKSAKTNFGGVTLIAIMINSFKDRLRGGISEVRVFFPPA